MDEKDFIHQVDSFQEFLPRLGTGQWFTASVSTETTSPLGREMRGLYCALIHRTHVEQSLSRFDWDLKKTTGRPGFSTSGRGIRYQRFGSSEGVEPLIHCRHFHKLRDDYLEVAEEFRLFHDLYLDPKSHELARFNYEDGADEIVGRPIPGGYELRMREVREFLAAKRMHLALFFDIIRFAAETAGPIPEADDEKTDKDLKLAYTFGAKEGGSRLVGKKLIPPLPRRELRIWPFEWGARKKERFDTFVIGRDSDGNLVKHTCDPEKLSNFRKNPGAPHYMTPVFFDRAVLQQYLDRPDKYTVDDGTLSRASLWILRIDNDHPTHVVVALGDLGRDLPERERGHWLSHNVPPEGGYSKTARARAFDGEFADATRSDLRFKALFTQCQKEWYEARGWHIFLPLTEKDHHFFQALRIPLTEDQREFDGQVLGLARILVDSLPETELRKRFGKPEDDTTVVRALVLLERLLTALGVADTSGHIEKLRLIQTLRSSGAAHRKGESYKKLAARLGSDPLPRIFEKLLDDACGVLETLLAVRATPLAGGDPP